MTKAEIASKIYQTTGIERKAVLNIIDEFMETIKENVIAGESVYLRGFGTFGVTKRAASTARNVVAGTPIDVPERFVPKFKPAPDFKKSVKQ